VEEIFLKVSALKTYEVIQWRHESLMLTIPTHLAQGINFSEPGIPHRLLERGLRQLKIERALERYAQGGITFGAAAQLAGISQSELARQAYARGMEPPFSTTTLAEERSNL
jgi:predicted HTH domain antitoxin